MAAEFTFRMGSKVRDKVTGFTGLVTARTQHISGCDVYAISPPVDKDGKYVDTKAFDEPRIELLDEPTQEHREIPVRARANRGSRPRLRNR